MLKTCLICNKEFDAKVWNRSICYNDHYKICKYCGEKFLLDKNTKGPKQLKRDYCYKDECISKNLKDSYKETMLERYGVTSTWQLENTKNSIKKTMLNKYGVDHPMKNKNIQQKAKSTLKDHYGVTSIAQLNSSKNTFINRYGVDCPFKSKEIQQKVRNTFKNHYNVDNIFQLESTKEKIKQTNLRKYGVEYYTQSDDYKEKVKNTCMNKYGVEYTGQIEIKKKKTKETLENKYGIKSPFQSQKSKETLIKHYKVSHPLKSKEIHNKVKNTCMNKYGVEHAFLKFKNASISKTNRIFSEELNNNNIENELEFYVRPYSYDIHVLNTNILIELNPTYTHNSTIGPYFNKKYLNPKDKYYHYNKTKNALENDYICIHKFDWNTNEEIINIIKNINNYKFEQKEPKLHWYNCKTKEHLLDNNFTRDEMIEKGFVEIYDDGNIN